MDMNLLVMDDAPHIRERIVELVSEILGIDEILESEDAASAVKLINERQPDVAILDIQVPPSGLLRNGIDVLRLTKQQSPKTGVIMLTNFANPRYRDECVRLGADFFFDKSSEFEQVPAAVMHIMRRTADLNNGNLPGG